MRKKTIGEHDRGTQLLGVVVFIVGLCLLFLFPIGTVIGLILMVAAGRMGYRRRKVWRCGSCRAIVERG